MSGTISRATERDVVAAIMNDSDKMQAARLLDLAGFTMIGGVNYPGAPGSRVGTRVTRHGWLDTAVYFANGSLLVERRRPNDMAVFDPRNVPVWSRSGDPLTVMHAAVALEA